MRSISEPQPPAPGSDGEHLEFARKIALDLLSIRPRSVHELRQKLAAKGVPESVVDELTGRFLEVGLLDDAQFAESLVVSRSQYSHRGRRRIREELRRKGIDGDTLAQALEAVDDEDEWAAARAVADKKMRSLRGVDPAVARRRLAGVLARRGFAPHVVMEVTRESLIGLTDDEAEPWSPEV